jgi:hypothetical protein
MMPAARGSGVMENVMWVGTALTALYKHSSARAPVMIRDDLSDKLVHLTRGDDQAAANAFWGMFHERTLRGGTGCIKGNYRCVCFSEAPLSKLAHILANTSVHNMRYEPFGVMVDKTWLYEKGGRPVIYQSEEEFDLLVESQKFRHVRYEPPAVDFTWEREWRIRNDVAIDPAASSLVVPNRAWERWALNEHTNKLALYGSVFSAIMLLKSVIDFPWHFVVLEDIGVPFPNVSSPP